MQRWEYLYVVCERDGSGKFRPRYVNANELSGWRSASLTSKFQEWGREGWEMVSYAIDQYATEARSHGWAGVDISRSIDIVFKRPL